MVDWEMSTMKPEKRVLYNRKFSNGGKKENLIKNTFKYFCFDGFCSCGRLDQW